MRMDLGMTQSLAVSEVVNMETAGTMAAAGWLRMFAMPSNGFEELHRQLSVVHQVCTFSLLLSAHVYAYLLVLEGRVAL